MVCNDRVECTDFVDQEQAIELIKDSLHHRFKRPQHRSGSTSFTLLLVSLALLSRVEGFATRIQVDSTRSSKLGWRSSHDGVALAPGNIRKMTIDDKNDNDVGGDDFEDFGAGDLEGSGVIIEDLNWRVEKLRLEEANTRRFLKSKPRFLPYDECAKWVQAFGRWETEEDWNDWIAMGEKRNSYIPSQPDQYYGGLGQWISWDHFLGVAPNDEKKEES